MDLRALTKVSDPTVPMLLLFPSPELNKSIHSQGKRLFRSDF